MKDGFENIYLFLRYMNLSCGEVSSIPLFFLLLLLSISYFLLSLCLGIRMDSFTMFIINVSILNSILFPVYLLFFFFSL